MSAAKAGRAPGHAARRARHLVGGAFNGPKLSLVIRNPPEETPLLQLRIPATSLPPSAQSPAVTPADWSNRLITSSAVCPMQSMNLTNGIQCVGVALTGIAGGESFRSWQSIEDQPSASTKARHSSSVKTEIATHRSSPRHRYAPWGAPPPCGRRLPVRVETADGTVDTHVQRQCIQQRRQRPRTARRPATVRVPFATGGSAPGARPARRPCRLWRRCTHWPARWGRCRETPLAR